MCTGVYGVKRAELMAVCPQLHREGSLVQLHSSGSDPHQQPLSVLTSVEGESGSVVSSKHRDPKTVRGKEVYYDRLSSHFYPYRSSYLNVKWKTLCKAALPHPRSHLSSLFCSNPCSWLSKVHQ